VIEETRDAELLAGFFGTDPGLYAYQLGDLDPFFFPATRWWITRPDVATGGDLKSRDVTGAGVKGAGMTGAGMKSADVTAALLLYTAFETPVIQALTDNDDQGELWRALLPTLPDRAHVHYRARHEPILRERYRLRPLGTHQKMQWTRPAASVGRSSDILVRVLTVADRQQIHDLYRAAYPGAYFDERTLGLERVTGAFADSRLVAIAACHVYSRQYSIAVIGAVATHPDYRKRGYCSAVTGALVNLLAGDVATIALNVHCDNPAAIRIYESLGFHRHHRYEEALIESFPADQLL
jgi:ribosomal protein S18 acetylase RimI-like enzyme